MSSSPGCQLSGEFYFYLDALLNNLKMIIIIIIIFYKLDLTNRWSSLKKH